MIWITILIICALCYILYKKGKYDSLCEANSTFKQYLNAHNNMKDLLEPGLDTAEHLINQLKDSLW